MSPVSQIMPQLIQKYNYLTVIVWETVSIISSEIIVRDDEVQAADAVGRSVFRWLILYSVIYSIWYWKIIIKKARFTKFWIIFFFLRICILYFKTTKLSLVKSLTFPKAAYGPKLGIECCLPRTDRRFRNDKSEENNENSTYSAQN